MKKFFFVFFFIVFLFNFSFAQESIVQKTDSTGFYRLNDVVISATRTNANSLELANSISIIDSLEIVNKNSYNIFDVLKNEYGLSYTQQGNKSGVSTVYIRGANSSHTLVLVDGVEVNLPNDPSNFYNFFGLPVDNISRIEVLRGPQSTLYGSDALAGVINIISSKGTGKPIFNFSAEGGSYNSYKGIISSQGAIEKFNYSIALSRIKSDGYSEASEKYGNKEKDGAELNNINTILGYDVSENFKLDVVGRFNKSSTGLDQSTGSPEIWDDPTYIFDQEEFFIRGQSQFSLLKGNWDQKLGITFSKNVRKYSYDTSAASIFYSHSLYDGRKYKADWQNDFHFLENNLITTGIEFEVEETASEYYLFNYIGLPDYASVFPKKNANTIGLYLQDQFKLNENFFGTVGIRYDHHNQFGSTFTYRIAPAYIFWETGTKLKATLGTGFKAPSLFYLYDPAYGNPDLDPEKSIGLDAGIEQFFWKEKISIGANYFYNKFTDMFGFDSNFKTINIKKAVTQGIEFFLKAELIDRFDLKANYTYTNAKDKSENTPDYNEELVRRPEHKAGLFVSYSLNEFTNTNVELIYIGRREDMDFSTFPSSRIKLADYLLVNLAAHYDVFSFLRLQARIENLFDKKYEEIYGYGTPGLSFYGGISLKIE